MPALRWLFIKVLSPFIPETLGHYAFLFTFFFILVSLFLILMFKLLSVWFSEKQSFLVILILNACLPAAWIHIGPSLWTIAETIFFILAIFAINKHKWWQLELIIIFATFNRETAIFIPFLYFFATFDVNKPFANFPLSLIYFFSWAMVYGGMRFALGSSPMINTIPDMFQENIRPDILQVSIPLNLWFAGIFWLALPFSFHKAPDLLKRLALVIPIYIPFILIFGMWVEVRLFMPLLPIIIPISVSSIFSPAQNKIKDYYPVRKMAIFNNPRL
jgi:hypothetical protein